MSNLDYKPGSITDAIIADMKHEQELLRKAQLRDTMAQKKPSNNKNK